MGFLLPPIANPKDIKYIQQENHQKYKVINDILYSYCRKNEASEIYVIIWTTNEIRSRNYQVIVRPTLTRRF